MTDILRKTKIHLGIMIAATVCLSSCASYNKDPIVEGDIVISDPMEEQNRRVFAFNQGVDRVIINPVVKGYRAAAPEPVRTGIRNVLRNLRSPITLANQLLQGDLRGAGDAFVRAAINTTIGVGGIFDVAGYEGIEYEPEDFGQTLAVWGVDHGPYLIVPILGPSSARDYAGYFVDSLADPLRWYLFNIDEEAIYYAKVSVDYIDLRESYMDVLKELQASSIDFYASVRSTYYQRREAMVYDLDAGTSDMLAVPSIPDYDNGDE